MFPAIVDKVAARLLQARRLVFAGAGHVSHMTHPDEFVATVAAFLAS